METIRAVKMTKVFKEVFRLGPLDLNVGPGEILGITGPSGAGKTTLLRLLWGFMRPDAGSISVFGMKPHLEQMKVRLRAGYFAETTEFYPTFTAATFLEFIGNFYEGWDALRARSLLEQLGVRADLKIEQLSKGDSVKLGLIAALGHRPSLLILDEPASGLDPYVRIEILHFLRKLAQDENVSIVLSSDISGDFDQIADSVLILNNGRAVEYAHRNPLISRLKSRTFAEKPDFRNTRC